VEVSEGGRERLKAAVGADCVPQAEAQGRRSAWPARGACAVWKAGR